MAVVVAQLAECALAIPEVRGSNPAIGKIYNELIFLLTVEKTKTKKKGLRMAHFLKKEERKRGREWLIFKKRKEAGNAQQKNSKSNWIICFCQRTKR